ncbi:MAG: RNA-binding transcriptional accessory protein, partial [candidate division Zixibacteria bacterium]|nr:RNA-binding transcriptional accessory protein [candidate division Zixibacteria bacterium]
MSKPNLLKKVADELNITAKQAEAVSGLLNSGATIPFIARYRKEVTGSLDEVAIQHIRDRLDSLQKLEDRRNAILDSLRERDLLDRELKMKILSAETMTELEDIYLPYRPKKRTRATIAREKGLEGLAETIYKQENYDIDASDYINPGKDVHTSEDAISGAEDIIAEWISEDADIRDRLRKFFNKNAYIESSVVSKKEAEAVKFRDYFDWKERISQVPSHRFLAIVRGQKEGYLNAHIRPEEEKALALIEKLTVKGGDKMTSLYVMDAAHDSYRRLIAPSLETEFINSVKREADKEAINVFTANLREILMAPPLGQKRILAIDPGFRTGCKVVALDGQGKLMGNITIYPTTGKKHKEQAGAVVKEMIKNFEIDAIALGNGTASRETESFLRELKLEIPVVVVDESGASIYSASKTAREEFPDHDVTVRGAVSIGRRLQDPLAEIVKIDPKSIGVGQYQHDVDQSLLKQALEDTVVSCVNAVGVEVNTAS